MSDENVGARRRIEVNWMQTLAGGLAAMSSAVLLSTVGVAGTLIGAALGSIVLTIGSAVYSHYLALSRERVAAARAAAAESARRVRARGRTGTITAQSEAGRTVGEGQPSPDRTAADPGETTEPGRVRWREVVRGLRWKRLAVVAVSIFVLAMGAILTFELLAGRSVSSYTGGSSADGPRTSLSLFGGGRERQEDSVPGREPTSVPGGSGQDGSDVPSDRSSVVPLYPREQATTAPDGTDEDAGIPSAEPTPEGHEPTPSPTAEATPSPTAEPTQEPTPEPTQEPTQEPTPVPTPEAAPSTAPQSAAAPG